NQYIKLAKKARVGADFAISQIGWDMPKLRDLLTWLRMRGLNIPVMASFMALPGGVAQRIHDGRIPGVIVTEDLLRRVREDADTPDKGQAVRTRRLALQLVYAKRIGMAGAQLTGIHNARRASELLDLMDALDQELPDDAAWQAAWDDSLRLADGSIARTAPDGGYYWGQTISPAVSHGERVPSQPGIAERAKFGFMHWIHRTCFEAGAPAAGLLGAASRIDMLEPLLTGAEIATKKPIAGCQTCGFCRLPYTQYVCPETCPKGLANGPCGGTSTNRCEFGDRECIHNARYRLAKAAGRLNDLEELIVPPVPDTRGTCSWTNHFEGRDPVVIRLKPSS
ncbi:MAG TPA: methylenetetrahydrofolate reductase C-terminal domain-containing protein, partial [Chloroflexota bacterium]|nr:methylenetetrahydrofolate reductase C-terminal domain-containing protein [Chloroflexota bacterium]